MPITFPIFRTSEALQAARVAKIVQLQQQLLGAPVVAVAEQEAAGAQAAVRNAPLVAECHRPQRTRRYSPAQRPDRILVDVRMQCHTEAAFRRLPLSTGVSATV